ncbi:Rieske (2Fe-2S) protein [Streptomyces sp. XM4193]|uniref:Rieske (2Fe-2S) protein n=1 Tax=Streptomyces sp. XM4193 TaxID=2929782 RepID=UPI001FF88EA7|nr:Rieske (2Fe-2S) protein [Streptomyces sp. XM4193]MCK1796462.1 Rieske (2Fe-2S) protein [Streptomyces sp. XM4193]
MHDDERSPSRRSLLCGAAAAGAAGLGLTACSGAGEEWPKSPAAESEAVGLGSADSVPVGGARLYRDDRLLISQPEQGKYRAFSAVCTHGGCVLSSVEKLEADCACHGSRFDAGTGKVLRSPATTDLPEYPVRLKDGSLVVGPAD